jgi:hypothetical protein
MDAPGSTPGSSVGDAALPLSGSSWSGRTKQQTGRLCPSAKVPTPEDL